MAIQILPLLGALSNVAGTAWDLYRRATQLSESRRDQQAGGPLAKAVERLEASHLEQAHLISDLSRDLQQFAQALQSEVEELRRQQAKFRALVYFTLFVALVTLRLFRMAKVKRSPLQQFKDAALEQALLLFLRPRFERYGEIITLRLDTSQRVLTAEVRLRGESSPLEVHEAHYRTEQRDGETRVIIYDVKVSREWAQHLLEDHFREISIKIPPLLRALVH